MAYFIFKRISLLENIIILSVTHRLLYALKTFKSREYVKNKGIRWRIDKATYTASSYNEEKVNQYIKRQIDLKRKVFAIMFGNEMVGELIIKNIEEHKCATLGLAMKNTQYKDRGFGTKAEQLAIEYVFHELDIPVLYADAILSNKRSQHVLEKVGFHLTREDGQFKYYKSVREPE